VFIVQIIFKQSAGTVHRQLDVECKGLGVRSGV